jgi:hypothetical protein
MASLQLFIRKGREMEAISVRALVICKRICKQETARHREMLVQPALNQVNSQVLQLLKAPTLQQLIVLHLPKTHCFQAFKQQTQK